MRKIEGYEKYEVQEFEQKEKLELGGHICVIKNIKHFEYNGIKKISLEIDIAEGNQKDFFERRYEEKKDNAKFWDSGATITFAEEPEKDSKEEKDVMTLFKIIESFNDGYKWNWEENTLVGKKIGRNFTLREYRGNDGNIYTQPQVSKFGHTKENFDKNYIPNVSTLENGFVPYEEYMKNKENNNNDPFGPLNDVVEIDNNFLD